MKREVVQDFLNLPGITGIALMDGRSRPYFCGVDQALNFQQKEALAQGIQQVVETTPTGFEFFEFQFIGHQVFIYKLEHGIILLVLTGHDLEQQIYTQAITQLKAELQDDATNAIATFRLLAGNITLSSQNYWKRRPGTTVSSTLESSVPSSRSETNHRTPDHYRNGSHNGSPISQIPHTQSPSASTSRTQGSAAAAVPPSADRRVNLNELLLALNQLSQFTTQYLGTTVITNYWKTTRPAVEWLNHFQIDRSAHFSFSGAPSTDGGSQTISAEEHQWLCEWIAAFIARCSKVIRDFALIIEQRALDDHQKRLLLPNRL